MGDNNKKTLSELFNSVKAEKDKFHKIYSSWNFNTLNKFIVSFEKLTQEENIDTSKRFGNIAKKITKDILMEDLGSVDLETGTRYTKKEILEHINKDHSLRSQFKKLYEEISKRNYWKLQMPLISTNFDLLLDRCNNDYERFVIVNDLYLEGREIEVKDINLRKKTSININIFESSYEQNELEKVFYILINKIRRKKDGKIFLEGYTIDLQNPFENKS